MELIIYPCTSFGTRFRLKHVSQRGPMIEIERIVTKFRNNDNTKYPI